MDGIRLALAPHYDVYCQGKVGSASWQEAGAGFTAHIRLDFTNSRLRLLGYEAGPGLTDLAARLEWLGRANGLGKIIWVAREADRLALAELGYVEEAFFPGYFAGQDGWYFSRFLDPGREQSPRWEEEDRLLGVLPPASSEAYPPDLLPDYELRPATAADIPALVRLYRETFSTYPSPITEEAYLQAELGRTALFQVVYHGGELVSAASAEMNPAYRNAEITDCATRPGFQGRGLIRAQILALEMELARRALLTAYSLARATSPGMNTVLHRLGYTYRGRLRNNCHICGGYEDMNLWVKELAAGAAPTAR